MARRQGCHTPGKRQEKHRKGREFENMSGKNGIFTSVLKGFHSRKREIGILKSDLNRLHLRKRQPSTSQCFKG